MARRAGVLIPLFSLRGRSGWGVGEIPDLVPFATWAKRAGCALVQLLPVNQVAAGQDSPYSAMTAFAVDAAYLAIDALEDFKAAGGRGALSQDDQRLLPELASSSKVRWNDVRGLKDRALRLAFAHFQKHERANNSARAQALDGWRREQAGWLPDYVLFAALHAERAAEWTKWEPELRRREPKALDAHRTRLAAELDYLGWQQWLLEAQWREARAAVHAQGIKLMGDLPFVVATDSADVWSRQHEFRLDTRVGVPPDAFSADGQDWGLPLYRWDVMARGGMQWFRARGYAAAAMFDFYRVDHVVGLYRTFHRVKPGPGGDFFPEREPDQKANGERVLRVLAERATVIAEDLGVVPDFVRTSLTGLGIPGYRVLRWEKEKEEYRDPARWPALSVAVSGTHDTDSLADWYESLDAKERACFLRIPGLAPLRQRAPTRFDDGVRDAVLELLYASNSDLVLTPFQDLLGHRERVNVPGTVVDTNWSYRIPGDLDALLADPVNAARIAALTARTGRMP